MSIPLIDTVVPQNSGNFPIVNATDMGGGHREVADVTARNAIPSNRRTSGMLVFQQSDSTTWRMNSDLTTWTQVTFGGSASAAVMTGDVTLAVSSTGNDNDPTRPNPVISGDQSAKPFATIQAALAALPNNTGGFYARINVSGETYAVGFNASSFFGGGVVDVVGNYTNVTPTTGVATGTAGTGTTGTALKKPNAAANWTAGELRGKLLLPTGGGGYYTDTLSNLLELGPCVRIIKDNTIDTLVLDGGLSLDNTTTFRIVSVATLVGASATSYGGALTYCAGAFSNTAQVMLRAIKPNNGTVLYGVLAQSNTVIDAHTIDAAVTGFNSIGIFDSSTATLSNIWAHGGSSANIDIGSGTRCFPSSIVLDNAQLKIEEFNYAAGNVDAKSCSFNALQINNVLFASVDANANSCTASPVKLTACHHYEPNSNGFTGTNAGTTYFLEISGGGQYHLTGSTGTSSQSNMILVEGDTSIATSWTELGLGTFAKYGNFLYWGNGPTRWKGAVSGYLADINVQTTNYTLSSNDTGRTVEMNSASALTLTLPNTMPAQSCFTVVQTGAGQLTFATAVGATLHNADSQTKAAGQYAMCTLYVTSNSDGSSAVYILGGRTGP